ncbi:MAG: hypothetical protein WDO14_25030 [Bacteroidota bacterium]
MDGCFSNTYVHTGFQYQFFSGIGKLSAGRLVMEARKSNVKCEFEGTSSITAFTINGYFPSKEMILPKASVVPKYLSAVDFVITTYPGPLNAFSGLPLRNLWSKILK